MIHIKPNIKRAILIGAIVVLAVIDLILATYAGVRVVYKDQFYPRTVIAGVNVSGMTLAEAEQAIKTKIEPVENRQISITIGELSYKSSPKEMGILLNWQLPLNKTYVSKEDNSIKNRFRLMAKTFYGGSNAKLGVNTDKLVFDAYLDAVLGKANREATDAAIQVIDGNFVIVKEIDGLGVSKESLSNKIINVVSNEYARNRWSEVVFTPDIISPKIKEGDLVTVKAQADEMIREPFAFTLENKTYKAEAAETVKWITFEQRDGKLSPIVNRSAVEQYVASLAKKVDVSPREKRISQLDESVIQEGQDGRTLEQGKLIESIITSLQNRGSRTIALEVVTRPFSVKRVPHPFTPGLYPGKYIEVNITEQRMYLWNGYDKVAEYIVSTGAWNSPTPIGTRYINNKIQRAYSRQYKLYLPWWLGLGGGGYGIHELPEWADGTKEGEVHLGQAVSHGCVRLGVGSAEAVYNWAEVEMPVYIHK